MAKLELTQAASQSGARVNPVEAAAPAVGAASSHLSQYACSRSVFAPRSSSIYLVMLSKLPHTAPVDVSVAPITVPVAVSAAQETAPEASTPVVNTSAQFTSLRSSWSLQRGRAREGQRVGQQVCHGDRLSLEGAGPDLQAVQVQRRRLLHQPGDRPAEGAEVQLRDSAQRRREVLARRAPHVVGCADVHHQVGCRAHVQLLHLQLLGRLGDLALLLDDAPQRCAKGAKLGIHGWGNLGLPGSPAAMAEPHQGGPTLYSLLRNLGPACAHAGRVEHRGPSSARPMHAFRTTPHPKPG